MILAHEGTKAYSDTFELVHRREATGLNAIWQADHTPLDILLIRPDGKTANPWLTVLSTTTAALWRDTFFRSKIHPP